MKNGVGLGLHGLGSKKLCVLDLATWWSYYITDYDNLVDHHLRLSSNRYVQIYTDFEYYLFVDTNLK